MEILDPLIRLSCVSWAQVVLEEELQDELPYNEYYEYYAPDFTLHYPTNSSVENLNTRQYVDSVKHQGAPSIAMELMPDLLQPHVNTAENPDSRAGSSTAQHPAEFYDGSKDQ
ncbi:MAG: hypothetical protein SGPRY_004478 [Prymnesium sp.]